MNCICGNPSENLETGDCASCGLAKRKAGRLAMKPRKKFNAVKKFSAKVLAYEYPKVKNEFMKSLLGKPCPIYPELKIEDCHHRLGRTGFADDWAKDNNISLLIDKRFFMGVSRKAHIKITNNPSWAIEQGYSLLRNQKQNL